jgi:hypothetical protein
MSSLRYRPSQYIPMRKVGGIGKAGQPRNALPGTGEQLLQEPWAPSQQSPWGSGTQVVKVEAEQPTRESHRPL